MHLKIDWSRTDIFLEDFAADQKLIDIRKTIERQKDIVSSLIAAHALSGCDSVPMMFGIGKGKVLAALKKQRLTFLGQSDSQIEDVLKMIILAKNPKILTLTMTF